MLLVTVHIGRGKFVTMMQSFLGNNITKEDLMRDNVICINTIRYESKSPLAKAKDSCLLMVTRNEANTIEKLVRPPIHSMVGERVMLAGSQMDQDQ